MKKFMLICAPVTSRSGYGAHARDLVWSLIEHNKYDVTIMDVPWGNTPRNALEKMTEKDKLIFDRILKDTHLPKQPDVYVDIRIPNEFQQIGKFNIGITAGIETNAVSQNWIECCNKMDLIIVPSIHSRDGFLNSFYEKLQQLPDGQQKKIGELRMEKPIEVLFEGSDEDVYKPLTKDEIDTEFFNWLNDEVPEKFAFLFVGLWGKGGFGEDRKDIGTMIKTFYESFANKKKQPALILKTNGATPSILSKKQNIDNIKQIKSLFPKDWKLPNVYLLNGDMTDTEMNYLYNHPKIKAMISFTHGEGYGRPLQEATMVGLPVMASGWSGHLDFLSRDESLLVPGKMDKVPASQHWENIIIPESQWFYIDTNSAYKGYNMLFSDIQKYKKNAKSLMINNRNKFTFNKMVSEFDEIMEKWLADIPHEVELALPKLKKVKETV